MFIKACLNGSRKLGDLCWLLVASDSQIRPLRTPNHISCFICCRSKFVAENALLWKPLIILRRQVKQPAYTKVREEKCHLMDGDFSRHCQYNCVRCWENSSSPLMRILLLIG